MGNDARFVEAENLPFRLIDVPIGSAPPPPTGMSHKQNKCHAPPIPPPRIEGYDAPPSLLPPPVAPKRFDQPVIHLPQRSDLPQLSSSTKKINHHRRKRIHKPKLACCVIC